MTIRDANERQVERVGRLLLARSFPRSQMLLILVLAGLGAFLCSAVLLRVGVSSMAARYFVAALVGYGLFLCLVRLWLAYQRHGWSLEPDIPGVSGGDGHEPALPGSGGSFEGGGASGSFGSPRGELDFVPDLDEAWPIALGVSVLLAGLAAIGFVVYVSPLLFAEVLLDAAVIGVVYRRARRRNRRHWLHGVVRRTALAALLLAGFVSAAGFGLQLLAPEAQSLGAVLRALSSP
jgi:hypothetical protein